MMAAFRAFAKSKAAAVLMAILVVAFASWGVKDVFHAKINDAVITAGSRQVSSNDFKRIWDDHMQQLQQQVGQAITAQEAVDHGVDKQVLEQLADREAIQEVIHRAGITPSDTLILGQVRKIPAFFNRVTGTFDQKAYEQALGEQKLTPAMFEADLRDEIAEQQYSVGMVGGLVAPRTYSALIALLQQQNRSADYFILDPKSVPTPAKPSDADLTKFMKEHEAELRRPELRLISMVRISAQNIALSLPADPAEVQKAFDFEKDRLSTPEKRTFVEVPAKDAAQAAAIASRLNKGEDATAVAKTFSAKPINYVDAAKSTVADPKVADAVFGLQPGQVSAPIQGGFGFSVVKLVNITPGKTATLADSRAKIEAEVKSAAAAEKADDQAHAYDDAHSGGAAMADAAKKAGVQVYQIGPITPDGRIYPSGQPATGLNARLLTEAFGLAQGAETDIAGLGKGEYYALRIEKVVPSAIPSLDEVRPNLIQVVMRQAMVKALQDKADAMAARLRKGESIAAVAAASGTAVKHAENITQANGAQQAQTLGQEFLARMFQAKTGETFVAPGPSGIFVAKLTTVQPGALADVARSTLLLRQRLTGSMIQNDMGQMLSQAAKTAVKPKIDNALARRIIGVTAEEAPDSSTAAKPPAKAQ